MESKKDINLIPLSVLIGFRFERSWRILDINGSIIDKILSDKKSPFKRETKYFDWVNSESRGKTVINKETDCFISINIDDLLFKHIFQTTPRSSNKDLSWFFNSIKNFIIPHIIVNFKIKQIVRVGIIYYHNVNADEINTTFMRDIIEDDSVEIPKFNLDFHKKYPVDISLAKKGVNDYKNVIYSIKHKQDEEDKDNMKYEISLDYQYYFEPKIDNIKEWNVNDFLDKSKSYLDNVFYPWVKKKLRTIKL